MKLLFNIAWPTIIAGMLYIFQAGISFNAKNYPMALTFLAYAIANVGLIWAMAR